MCAFRSRAGMNAASTTSSTRALAEVAVKNGSSVAASANGTPSKTSASVLSMHEERLQKILETIESGKPCTIHALAQDLNLSPSHLQHMFKQQTGICLGHLLTEQKLRRAAYLLTHSNLRIKEIASSAGYEHTSSFIRAFERHFAQPPRLYRQKQQARPKS